MSCKFHSRSTTTLLILILIGLFLVSESRQQQQDDDSPEWTSQSVTRGQFYDDQDSSRSDAENRDRAAGIATAPAKTFEQIVLDGSKVRLACPHAAISMESLGALSSSSSSSSSFVTAIVGELESSKQKQLSSTMQQTPKLTSNLVNTATNEQVKWFRNHVPLLNLNYFRNYQKEASRETQHSNSVAPQVTVTAAASLSELNQNVSEQQLQEANIEDGRLTIPLAIQTTFSADKKEKNLNELDKKRKLLNLPTTKLATFGYQSLEVLAGDKDATTATQNNGSNEQWHINKFGELVINKVSKYFAGKYTCLYGGEQSELLLDVLTDNTDDKNKIGADVEGQEENAPEAASKMQFKEETLEQADADTSDGSEDPQRHKKADGDATNAALDAAFERSSKKRQSGETRKLPEEFEDSEAGNSQIEAKGPEKVGEDAKSAVGGGSGAATSTLADVGQPALAEQWRAFTLYDVSKSVTTTEQPSDFSLDKDSSPRQINSINTPGGDVGRQVRNYFLNVDKIDAPLNEQPYQFATSRLAHHSQRRPLHFDENEIVSSEDLGSIPGLLYTKQQFHCPALRQIDLIGYLDGQIDHLIGAFCPSNLKSERNFINGENLECHKLARRLIFRLIKIDCARYHETLDESSFGSICAETATSFLDIVWFKDGEQLQFDSNGRSTNPKLNVKLIDLLDRYRALNNRRSGEVFSEHRGPRKTNDFLSIAHNNIAASLLNPRKSRNNNKQRPETTTNTRIKWPACPLKGLTLEIDGIRKDNAGRYTCALKLSIPKLGKVLKSLGQLNESSLAIKWANCVRGNDILCCDGPEKREEKSEPTGTTMATFGPYFVSETSNQKTQSFVVEVPLPGRKMGPAFDSVAPIERPKDENHQHESRHNSTGPINLDENNRMDEAIVLARGDSLSGRITILGSILNASIPSEKFLDYIEQVTTSNSRTSMPFTELQTFTLAVSERPANSCSLWSTISEASNAYSRRKLADFKRLKRSLITTSQQNLVTTSELIRDKTKMASASSDRPSLSATSSIRDDRKSVEAANRGTTIQQLSLIGTQWRPTVANRRHYEPDDEESLSLMSDDNGAKGQFIREDGQHQTESDEKSDNRNNDRYSNSMTMNNGIEAHVNGARVAPIHQEPSSSGASNEYKNPNDGDTGAATISQQEHNLLLNNAAARLGRPAGGTFSSWNNDVNGATSLAEISGPRGTHQTKRWQRLDRTNRATTSSAPAKLDAELFNYANEGNLKPPDSVHAATTRSGASSSTIVVPVIVDEPIAISNCVSENDNEGALQVNAVTHGSSHSTGLNSQHRIRSAPTPPGSNNQRPDANYYSSKSETKDLITNADHSHRINIIQRPKKPMQPGTKRRKRSIEISQKEAEQYYPAELLAPVQPIALSLSLTNELGSVADRVIDDLKDIPSERKPVTDSDSTRREAFAVDQEENKRASGWVMGIDSFFDNSSPLSEELQEANNERLARFNIDQAKLERVHKRTRSWRRHRQLRLLAPTQLEPEQSSASSTMAKENGDNSNVAMGMMFRPQHDPSHEHKLQRLKTRYHGGKKFNQQSDKSAHRARPASPNSDESGNQKRRSPSISQSSPIEVGQDFVNVAIKPNSEDTRDFSLAETTPIRPTNSAATDQNGSGPNSGSSFGAVKTPANDGSLIGSSSSLVMADDDESLLWAAGQYLYLHMKAFATLSLYGVQVDVEWSNERVNGTNIDFVNDKTYNGVVEDTGDKAATVAPTTMALGEIGYVSSFTGLHTDIAPFATIDLVPGQNLHLECTAQALGRLPEVKWYKRIKRIPAHLTKLGEQFKRQIGQDIYWPLTELDLLDGENSNDSRSFVCSQSITIFDNLVNQTFTVVNSLQLSQYNDTVGLSSDYSDHAGNDPQGDPVADAGGHYNLYACIVDADIRHNYATLGVHFRETGKISFELSKRLHAKSMMEKDIASTSATLRGDNGGQSTNELDENDLTKFNFLRDGELKFPINAFWVPIKNGTTFLKDENIQNDLVAFPMTPAVLSAIIVVVFSSLLALVYLTLRSYQALTSFNMEDEDLNVEFITKEQSTQQIEHQMQQTAANGSRITDSQTSNCSCRYEQDVFTDHHHQQASSSMNQVVGDNIDSSLSFFSDVFANEPLKHSSSFNFTSNTDVRFNRLGSGQTTLYDAHFHNIGTHYICHIASTSLIPEIPSNTTNEHNSSRKPTPPDGCSFDEQNAYQHLLPGCCIESADIVSMTSSSCQNGKRSRVNMIENPLSTEINEYSIEDSRE